MQAKLAIIFLGRQKYLITFPRSGVICKKCLHNARSSGRVLDMNANPIKQAIEKSGGVAELSRALNITYEAVRQWDERNTIPAGRVIEVERISGVSRHLLRPDIYPE